MHTHYNDAGKLLLRLLVGGLLVLHGIHKIINGPSGIEHMVAMTGLPGALGWLVYLGEVLGPVLVLIGYYARIGGLLIFFNMIVAVLLVHFDFGSAIWALNKHGGWVMELEGFFGIGGLLIFLMGAGRYSVGGAHSKYN